MQYPFWRLLFLCFGARAARSWDVDESQSLSMQEVQQGLSRCNIHVSDSVLKKALSRYQHGSNKEYGTCAPTQTHVHNLLITTPPCRLWFGRSKICYHDFPNFFLAVCEHDRELAWEYCEQVAAGGQAPHHTPKRVSDVNGLAATAVVVRISQKVPPTHPTPH